MRPKVLIITPNALHNGPRLIREMDALKHEYNMTAVGATPPHDSSVKYIPFSSINFGFIDRVIRKLWRTVFGRPFLGNLPVKEKRIHRLIKQELPDIVIAHYPIELPYLFSFPNRTFKIVYNAHEYHPLEFDSDPIWMNSWGRLYAHIYRNYLKKVDLLVNVCESIAQKCEQEFGKKSLVIPNAAMYYPEVKPFHSAEQQGIKIIHHGASIVDRKIELMIDAVIQLGPGYSLDLMLMPSNIEYHHFLVEKTKQATNVRLIEPVAFDKIVPFINKYDIGLFNLPPNNYNYAIALPNKLYEFIQARLCIVVSPSVEMKRVVEQYNLGKVSSGFTSDSIADTIRQLSFESIGEYKLNADKAAFLLSAERYQEQFIESIKRM